MKTVSPALAAHLSLETTTLATCWRLQRRDGTLLGFTDHDADLTISGLIYAAATGFLPGAVESAASLAAGNMEVQGMLAAGSIAEEDILAGRYDFAELEVFMVNYRNLSQGVLKLRRGWLGEVSLSGNRFVAEVRGLAQALSQHIGELFSPSCRATLGDSRCKIDLAAHTVSGTIATVNGRLEFTDAGRSEASGLFTAGLVTFTSGANDGLSMEIKEYQLMSSGGGRFYLALPMPYALAPGDTCTLSKGCDKTLATCRARFANVANFRGEPHVPGLDRMLETAGTRSVW